MAIVKILGYEIPKSIIVFYFGYFTEDTVQTGDR